MPPQISEGGFGKTGGMVFEFELEYKCNNDTNLSLLLFDREHENKTNVTSHSIKLQAFLATYYTGSTVDNMRFFFASMGLPNLQNWSNTHYFNCEIVQDAIINETEDLINNH